MSQNSKDMIKEFSIKELFEAKDNYLIPRYQRNYTWGESEVKQLAMDINDYVNKDEKSHYYIGTLVVFKRDDGSFETIDGQQRLTTLSIMLSVLKNEFNININFHHLLRYESRKISTNTLQYMHEGKIEDIEEINPSIKRAYEVLKTFFKNSEININNFKKYLLKRVRILRVEVPKNTDLNHYFEIMNNRGEQLEKHEVLKARLLSRLTNDNDKKIFNVIWEACSDMNRYVQYGFSTDLRDKIFGDNWDNIVCKNFIDIAQSGNNNGSEKKISDNDCNFTIDDILNNKCKLVNDLEENSKDEDKPDRFLSPINFQNFLLHAYKITKNNEAKLDDKELLKIINIKDEKEVKKFGYNLLQLRFLVDKYVIKRDYAGDKEDWSLKQAYKYTYKKKNQKNIQYKNSFSDEEKNKQIIMILSMFHVSNPSQNYKYWLSGVLNYLFTKYQQPYNIIDDDYLKYLEDLAKKFLKNRYLAKEPQEFDKVIFGNNTVNNDLDLDKLNLGIAVEHFIFNYLDYLLWKQDKKKFNYFDFSFSNSVEHFYPQHPIDEYPSLTKKEGLDNFGNLCLISQSKNAKLNNHPPISKKAHYPNGQYDSCKQHKMMEKAEEWSEKAIKEHEEEMINILWGATI